VQPKAAYKVATGKPKAVLAEITKGNLPTVTTAQEASHAAQAIQALPNGFNFDTESILTLLDQCSSVLVGKNTLSFVRRAICRVDEMLFADDAPDSSNHQI
jgi:thymidine phosphorylase